MKKNVDTSKNKLLIVKEMTEHNKNEQIRRKAMYLNLLFYCSVDSQLQWQEAKGIAQLVTPTPMVRGENKSTSSSFSSNGMW
jgi:hypothetical protein